tara:strand:+ start:3593 stop:3895 length:303 start_codon:yes stop_codon:yes gene_type:complete
MAEELLEKPMMVMEIRPEFSIQYKAKPKIKFKVEHLKDTKAFKEFLKKTTKNWKSGNYFLRSDVGPFAGFEKNKKGTIKLQKANSKNTPYLCWQFIGKRK